MKKRNLGGLEVSEISLGCMGMTHAYGSPADKKEMTDLIRTAYDAGYTMFDTAEAYIGRNPDGTTEYNEELVGNALKGIRDKVVIATKFGVHHTPAETLVMDSNPETIRKSVETSLKRLGTDYIDLYYQHRLDPKTPVEDVADMMNTLIKEGKILHWGISEADEDSIRRAHAVSPLSVIQNRYSMMARWHENLFPVLEELGIGYVAFSPLANGVLTDGYKPGETFEKGDFRNRMPQYTPEAYEANRALTQLLKDLAEDKNATEAQISLAWMLAKKPYIVPIPGSRKKSRILENADASDVVLSEDELTNIDEKLDHMTMSGVFGGSAVQK